MHSVCIIGTGPTALYTLHALLAAPQPLSITFYEKSGSAGTGMPYRAEVNDSALLANIASIELPPLLESLQEWLETRSKTGLDALEVDIQTVDERTFLPRVVLGTYFRDQFFRLLDLGQRRGFSIKACVDHEILDIVPQPNAMRVSGLDASGAEFACEFDEVVVATGHTVVADTVDGASYFDSPYPTSRLHGCDAGRVGILGTSLSGIDAAIAIAGRHGAFSRNGSTYTPSEGAHSFRLTMMSRNGNLPEADFYCPLPYEPLDIFTEAAVDAEIAAGSEGLLDRLFALFMRQLLTPGPSCPTVGQDATADTFAELYFLPRAKAAPLAWARENLRESEENSARRHTVAWRYAILRMHEPFERAVGSFDEADHARFTSGLKRVFVDNYAAIPPASVRRILALADAGCLTILRLGDEYTMSAAEDGPPYRLASDNGERTFDAVVVAIGEPTRTHLDYPFTGLIEHLERVERFGRPCTLDADFRIPGTRGGSIYFLALPYLLEDRPFVQGLVACHELGSIAAASIIRRAAALGGPGPGQLELNVQPAA